MKFYPGRKNLFFLFLLAFVFKFLTAIFLRYLLSCAPVSYHLDELVIKGHDYFSYHGAMENYIQTGKYYFFNGKKDVYAGRMPHFSLLYLLFRQFLNIALANFMVVVTQIGLESIAVILLALLAARVIRTRFSFYLTYAFCILSLPVSFYSIIVLPDSFSVSFLIFFVYHFYFYLKHRSGWRLLIAGVFLSLLVVLKPYFSLLYVGVGIFFLLETRNWWWKVALIRFAAKIFSFAAPLLILLVPWIIRNYQIYHCFIPFQVDMVAGYNYTKADLAARRYLQTFGDDLLYWDNTSAGYYFKTCTDNCSYRLPESIFTPNNSKSQVAAVRKNYLNLQKNYTEALDQKVAAAFDKLTFNFAQERPFSYLVLSRLTSLKNFLNQARPAFLPLNENAPCYHPFYQLIYYLQVGLYWSALTLGFTGLWLLGRKDRYNVILLAIPVYLLILFPLVLKLIEGRYFLHSYPFLLIGLVFILERLRIRLFRK